MTRSSKNEEQYNNDSKIDIVDNRDNPDFAEGLLPPTNQNIMPYYVQVGDNLKLK